MKNLQKVRKRKEKINVFKLILEFLSLKRLIRFLSGLAYDWADKGIEKQKEKVKTSIERTKNLKHGRRTKVSKRRLE